MPDLGLLARRCKRCIQVHSSLHNWVGHVPLIHLSSYRDIGDLPGGSGCKESAHNAGELGSIPGLGRLPGEGKSYPLQYSGLENSMDCIDHMVTKSWNCVTFILILRYHIFHCDHLNAFLSPPEQHTQVLKSIKARKLPCLFLYF